MRKITKYLAGVIAAALTIGTSAFAAEYSVTPVQATWYTNDQTVICSDADANTVVVPTCDSNIPVNIIGVTSNGFWQVQLDQVYYIPGAGLSAQANDNAVVNATASDASTVSSKYTWHKKDWLPVNVPDVDMTTNPTYIAVRDELEKQYMAGNKELDYPNVECRSEGDSFYDIVSQVFYDMMDDHDNIERCSSITMKDVTIFSEGELVAEKSGGMIGYHRVGAYYIGTCFVTVK